MSNSDQTPERVAENLKAIADPIRLKILRKLSHMRETKKLSVSRIAEELAISQPNVSHHIKILKSAGFVRCTKKGGCSYYVTDPTRMHEITAELSTLIGGTVAGDE